MKILLFGGRGQVGWQLRRSLAPLGEVVALAADDPRWCGDLLQPDGLRATVAAVRPEVVVNAAAYTAVDRAEDEPERAFAVNARACEALAQASAATGAWLVHYSTDYVYDGSGTQPWREDAAPAPLGVYGRSKLEGDRAVAAGNPRHLILRTSWVYDTWGRNFVKTILRAAATRDELQVVADQWGAPTRAALIADVTAYALQRLAPGLAGTYHLAAAGETSWHGLAQLALAEGLAHGLPLRARPARCRPVTTAQYGARAPRPANSRLDTTRLRTTFGVSLPAWEDGVRQVVAELAQQVRLLEPASPGPREEAPARRPGGLPPGA